MALTAPVVARAYTVAASWEENAPLTEEQKEAIAALGQIAAERPFPAHLNAEPVEPTEKREEAKPLGSDANSEASVTKLTEVVLQNSHQFYKWYTDLESAMKSETEEKYRDYVNTLSGHLGTCNNILKQLDDTLLLFDDLQAQHQAVTTKTKTLHDACDRLVMEKDRLAEFADTLRSKLVYFDELENIATKFYAPTMNVGSEEFLPLLKRLDECITFVNNNPQYADSSVYLVKFKQLQARALGMVRSHVQSVLKSTSIQVQAGIREAAGRISASEGVETSVLYVRFKAAASELKPLMEALESRAKRTEYAVILSDCHTLYCEQRLSLVHGVVQQRISEYARKESLPSFTRSGCAYLMQVCQLEHQLFDHFFPSSSSEASTLAPLTDPLCTILYDALRPKFIHETSLDLLCELVDILKFEVLEEQLGRRGEPVAGLKPTIMRILADVQERLTFRVQTYLRNEVANYLPLQEDLDYPGKLEKQAGVSGGSEEEEAREATATLYPPLAKTLACLAKLYRCVEPTIFTGLAQEAVVTCAAAIQRGSKLILKKASEMDGQLFLIKHLLILREQIAPFDIDFAVTHKELDFAHGLDHFRRILRGQASLFELTSRTSLARTFSPRVLENQVDAKKELEKSLKTTCEQFIKSVTKLTVEPMLSFITKVTAVKVAYSSKSEVGSFDSDKPLKEQAFATPEKVTEMITKVEDFLKEELPSIVSKMKLYLQNPSTQSILFKPIKSNILEAYSQVLNIVETEYVQTDVEKIQMMSLAELTTKNWDNGSSVFRPSRLRRHDNPNNHTEQT